MRVLWVAFAMILAGLIAWGGGAKRDPRQPAGEARPAPEPSAAKNGEDTVQPAPGQLLGQSWDPRPCSTCGGAGTLECPTCPAESAPPDDPCCGCGGAGELTCDRCRGSGTGAAELALAGAPPERAGGLRR